MTIYRKKINYSLFIFIISMSTYGATSFKNHNESNVIECNRENETCSNSSVNKEPKKIINDFSPIIAKESIEIDGK